MSTQSSLVRLHLHEIMTRCHELIRCTCDPYRPELHYMRGPGPKWRAKYGSHTAIDAT
jgi:hypothetical protein